MEIGVATADIAGIKLNDLKDELGPLLRDGLIVAFSGGVDSSFLLWAAEQERQASGGRLLALTTQSESLSTAEQVDVNSFIKTFDLEHVWKDSRELTDPKYIVNDASRCFHCKTELFRICREVADERGFKWIAYGYNASDRGDVRPGQKAAIENSILSPLADAELSKDEIRELMRRNKMDIAEKPASPCLSSRLMTGVPITAGKLKDVEEIEAILRDNGVNVFRVRFHETGKDKFLRIEVATEEMERAFKLREVLADAGRARGFRWVTFDLAGYSTGGGNVIVR
jgi:uncharacterized protein